MLQRYLLLFIKRAEPVADRAVTQFIRILKVYAPEMFIQSVDVGCVEVIASLKVQHW